MTGEDARDLAALLSRHSEFEQKAGAGVSHFKVMDAVHGTRCFQIVRVDGTATDFSYRHCIDGRRTPAKALVCRALREVIRPDILTARDAFFAGAGPWTCGVTGDPITPRDAHVDHVAPMTFEVIVRTFLASRGMDFDDVTLTAARDEQFVPGITDRALANEFREYHARVAVLDVVLAGCNLSSAAGARIRRGRLCVDLRSRERQARRARTLARLRRDPAWAEMLD